MAELEDKELKVQPSEVDVREIKEVETKKGTETRKVKGTDKVIIGTPPLIKIGSYTDKTIAIHLYPVKKDPSVRELLVELRDIAQAEFRNVNQQAFCFIKDGIEKWKKEHHE